MRIAKIISAVLHPIVMPIIGVLIFLIYTPITINKEQQYALLGIVFLATYVIPLILLTCLKFFGRVSTYDLPQIHERKLPVIIMVILFEVLASICFKSIVFRELSWLFHGTALSLVVVYLLFFLKTKTSLHVLSLGNATGFFLLFGSFYGMALFEVVACCILLAGILGSARLHLKAHTPLEVYFGFFIGLGSQLCLYAFL